MGGLMPFWEKVGVIQQQKRGEGQCATNKIGIGQDILLKIFTCITNCLNQSCGRTDIYTEWSQNYMQLQEEFEDTKGV